MKSGGMSAGLGVLGPGFQFWFCCVTLGKSPSLSGYLCCKWTRLFQRSLKTVIPCTCPRMGAILLGAPYHPTLLLGFPGTPGGLKGWELAMPVAPPGPSSSTTGPVHCLHLTDKWPPEGERDPSGSSASTQLNPCHPMLWAPQVEGSQLA